MKIRFKEFLQFKKTFNHNYLNTNKTDKGIFIGEFMMEDNEQNKIWETEKFLNIGFNSKNSLSKILSNLYPYSFKFKGRKVASIEGVLQSLKYSNKKIQTEIQKYSGLNAYHTRGCNTNNFWGKSGYLYWQGRPMKRDSEEYQLFLDELYFSCAKNILFRTALLETGDKILLHHIGNENVNETVLTRYEYESRLTVLREYLKSKTSKQ